MHNCNGLNGPARLLETLSTAHISPQLFPRIGLYSFNDSKIHFQQQIWLEPLHSVIMCVTGYFKYSNNGDGAYRILEPWSTRWGGKGEGRGVPFCPRNVLKIFIQKSCILTSFWLGNVLIESYKNHIYINVVYSFSRSRSLYGVARPSVACLSSACLTSVTFVHPTQPVEIFGNDSRPFSTLAIHWHPRKILRRLSLEKLSAWRVKHKRVAKYSDIGPIEGYISETVQDRR